MLIQPSPKPVITMTSAPMVWARVPSGCEKALSQWMLENVRIRNSTVNAPVSQVSTDWSRMIVW